MSCPNCGCPNSGNFKSVDNKGQKLSKYAAMLMGVVAVFILIISFFVSFVSEPVITDSPFYDIKKISHQEVIERYGEPHKSHDWGDYFEYSYETVTFMGIKGSLVFRFENVGESGDLIFARWTIDGAKYSEKKIEKICDFYDKQFDKRDVRNDGSYEWDNWKDNDRIWFRKPEYAKGYYEFEYRPW